MVPISLILLAVACSASLRRFDGDVVYRIDFREEDIGLHRVLTNLDREDVEFWSRSDLHVSKSAIPRISALLDSHKVPYSTLVNNVQDQVDREQMEIAAIRDRELRNGVSFNPAVPPEDDPFFNNYRPLEEIFAWCEQVRAEFPNLVEVVQLNTTYEGRRILAVKITYGTKGIKPVIFWEGGIHAREWITHSSMAYLISKLVNGYGTDPDATSLLNNFEVHIVPVVNGDGYHFTWTADRMWRKTRKPNTGSPCIGTDPNRNWDNHWCEVGASTVPCSDSYCGSNAWSEREVLTMANHIQSTKSNNQVIKSFIDWHAYGQLFMGPYGYTASPPKDAGVQANIGNGAVAAIQAVYGTVFQYGRINTIIYPASGSSADWGYDNATIVYSYGVELRDTGTYGFQLPPDQIRPSGEEVWAVLKYFGQNV